MKDEEIENLLLKTNNSKIREKIEFLRINEKFQKKARVLRKKWTPLIKEYNYYLKKIRNLIFRKLIKSILRKLKILSPSQKEKDVAKPFGGKIEKIVLNTKFQKDIINLTKESKLYPLEYWKGTIMLYILTKHFFSPTYFMKLGLAKNIPKKEIANIPKDLNFAIKIEKNKKTKEAELFVQIFENTILRDLKKNWKLIAERQEELRKRKGVEKRFYPHKNLEIEKKLVKLDSKKMSDWEKQEEIYGVAKGLDFGKIENKRKNRLKKIRQRLKKKMKQ